MTLRPGCAAFHCLTAVKSRSSCRARQRSMIWPTSFISTYSLGVLPDCRSFGQKCIQPLVGVMASHQFFEIETLDPGNTVPHPWRVFATRRAQRVAHARSALACEV